MHKPTRREADNFVHKWHLEQQRLVGIVVDTHLIDAPRTSTTTRSRRASPRPWNLSDNLGCKNGDGGGGGDGGDSDGDGGDDDTPTPTPIHTHTDPHPHPHPHRPTPTPTPSPTHIHTQTHTHTRSRSPPHKLAPPSKRCAR